MDVAIKRGVPRSEERARKNGRRGIPRQIRHRSEWLKQPAFSSPNPGWRAGMGWDEIIQELDQKPFRWQACPIVVDADTGAG